MMHVKTLIWHHKRPFSVQRWFSPALSSKMLRCSMRCDEIPSDLAASSNRYSPKRAHIRYMTQYVGYSLHRRYLRCYRYFRIEKTASYREITLFWTCTSHIVTRIVFMSIIGVANVFRIVCQYISIYKLYTIPQNKVNTFQQHWRVKTVVFGLHYNVNIRLFEYFKYNI